MRWGTPAIEKRIAAAPGFPIKEYWQVGSSATLGTGTTLVGSILAQASITLTTGAGVSGRLLARTGAVTLDGSSVSVCALTGNAPALSKEFNPSTINAGGVSTLTVTLSNPHLTIATLTAPLIDTLPNGVVVAPNPNVATTCGGVGTPIAVAGANTVTLPAGRTIPANGSCNLTVNVTAAAAGVYVNTLVAGALVTNHGSNAAPASATLIVNAVPLIPHIAVPALSTSGLLLLSLSLMLVGFAAVRMRTT